MESCQSRNDLAAEGGQAIVGNCQSCARRPNSEKLAGRSQTIEFGRHEVAHEREMREIDQTFDLQQPPQSLRRVGFGSGFEKGEPRRQPPAATRREWVHDSAAGESEAGSMVAEHGTVAVECRN